ncbi:Scd6p Ecym_4444 [Eremothecium cymbalariae DBVPG|uniref:DFDF domain-containing protein n=1 Tax=Eremothecium cymbalariae (strain CBS 270.75 / DBVPG 7215 / KCTC 17166 / NRRL Y-17582) TaxID=931890 RepID=G8JTY6_ERECY|nr:hypothetical protein Ecym_4444 [Eremothecium cymbalariae DBVPG\
MSQYIGKTISLISNNDNRYVGLLEAIDSEQGIVTLNNVRCFGTEGRKNWGPEEVYPNPAIYNSVVFNGNDVKDLSILDCALEQVQPALPSHLMVPANNEAAVGRDGVPVQGGQVPPAVAGYGVYAPERKEAVRGGGSTGKGPSVEKADVVDAKVQAGAGNNDGEKVKKQQGKPKIAVPNKDFDFESNNAKFSRTSDGVPESNRESEQVENANNNQNDEVFYDKKSSFFDSISTSTEANTNMKWQEERQLNMDTFGQASARPRNNKRGRFRGRGRGRGGRFPTRNHGGYRNGNTFRDTKDVPAVSEKVEF